MHAFAAGFLVGLALLAILRLALRPPRRPDE